MDSYSSFADVEVSAAEKRLGIVLFSVDLSYFVLLLFEKREGEKANHGLLVTFF